MSQKYNSDYINELEAFFIGRNDIVNRYGNAISHHLTLPGLIGFWPMATVQRSTGNVPNYAPTYTGATKQDLVYNGNPKFNYLATGVPYIDLDGTGDYLRVADNTDLDILGTETQYAHPGLTMGCWVNFDSVTPSGINYAPMSKIGVAGQFSYGIYIPDGTSTPRALVSVDGTATTIVNSTSIAAVTWYHIAMVFVPSTSLSIFINGVEYTNTTSIPASIFNSSTAFEIGSIFLGQVMPGNITLAFLSASSLSGAIIQSLFQQTRSLFGV